MTQNTAVFESAFRPTQNNFSVSQFGIRIDELHEKLLPLLVTFVTVSPNVFKRTYLLPTRKLFAHWFTGVLTWRLLGRRENTALMLEGTQPRENIFKSIYTSSFSINEYRQRASTNPSTKRRLLPVCCRASPADQPRRRTKPRESHP